MADLVTAVLYSILGLVSKKNLFALTKSGPGEEVEKEIFLPIGSDGLNESFHSTALVSTVQLSYSRFRIYRTKNNKT